jgi:hypothetical protein
VIFWNEGDGFTFEYNGNLLKGGEIYDFDQFLTILLSQKQGLAATKGLNSA